MNRKKLKTELLKMIEQLPSGDDAVGRRMAVEGWQRDFVAALLRKKPYLLSNEAIYLSSLIDGTDLDSNKISPQLLPCTCREDYDLYDYLRMLSSFPTQDRPGRRMKFLVRDVGHPGAPVMGICCLSSTIKQLKALDQWIGWAGKEWQTIRTHNLAFIMDISTCLGIPPYSYLTSGKLLCYMMLSNEVRELYRQRYEFKPSESKNRILKDIVLLLTTGAFGENTPQYKGITFSGQKQFRLIGLTSGYSTFQVSPALYKQIKQLVNSNGQSQIPTIDGGASAKLRILRYGARELGIDEEQLVFSGHRRAVFAAPIAVNWREFLRMETQRIEYCDYPLQELINEWKSRWLRRRLRARHVRTQISAFRPDLLRISRLIDARQCPKQKSSPSPNET